MESKSKTVVVQDGNPRGGNHYFSRASFILIHSIL